MAVELLPGPGEVAYEVLKRSRDAGWRDFDPYDGLMRIGPLLPDRAILTKRVLTQMVMRTSPRLRWLVGVTPHREAYTTGLLLSTTAVLGERAIDDFADELLDVLDTLRIGSTGAWGYGFPVVTRAGRYGPETPNLISTAFAALGIIDIIEATEDRTSAKPLVIDASNWIITDLWDDDVEGFRYHPGNREFIYNASILGALLLARSSDLVESEDSELAKRATIKVMAAQLPDGSWPYGESRRLNWVDNHHTAFILKALLLMPEAARPAGWRDTVERGLSFFVDHLLTNDGAPKPAPNRRYPIDGLAAGQAVETLAIANVVLGVGRYLEHANATFLCTKANLRRRDGRYRFRRGRYFNWPGAYLRWGEVHTALGAARLSAASAG